MKVTLKSRQEIDLMRAAGRVVHQTLERCRDLVRSGVSTAAIDALALQTYTAAGAAGLFKNYPTYRPGTGFPGNTCISVNDEVVHGIPGPRILKDGDVVSVDCGIRLGGWCGDSAITVAVGGVQPQHQTLIRITQETLDLAIRLARPGIRWSDIASQMQRHVEEAGFSCVREFVGHGIGQSMHEEPKIPNFVAPEFERRGDFYLQAGMTLAIEPMVIVGGKEVVVLDDGWTVVTKDGSYAAHIEHTIAITSTGSEVLTNGE